MEPKTSNLANSKIPLQNGKRDEVSLKLLIECDDIVEKLSEEQKKPLVIKLEIGCDDVSNSIPSEVGIDLPEILLESDQMCRIEKGATVADTIKREEGVESEEKMDQKMNGTCVKLFGDLQQENIQELQEQKRYNGKLRASCSSDTKLKKIFERHLDKHSGKVLFKCLYCQFQSKHLKGMMGHINSTHQIGSEMVQCDRRIYPKIETQERICGLCLKICDNFKAVEGNMKDILDVVLPKIDLGAIQELVVCTHCTDMLIKCSAFKTTCLNTYNYIISFANNRDDVKLNLRVIYLSKNDIVAEDQVICGLCMDAIRNGSAITLDVEERDVLLKKMMTQCLPELDFSLIEKPVICSPCHRSLENCFHFVKDCLLVEERIKKYCETLDINSRGQIELSHLLEFKVTDVITSEINNIPIDIIKEEKQLYEERENADGKNSDNEGGLIKSEPMFCGDSENASVGENKKLDETEVQETFCGVNDTYVKEESVLEMGDQKCLIKEEIEMTTDEPDFVRVKDGVVLPQPKVSTANQWTIKNGGFRHNSCSYKGNLKDGVQHRLLVYKNSSKITLYKCNSCPFLARHKESLEKHLTTHKNPSEVTLYKCQFCSYQTKSKDDIKTHLPLHGNPSKEKMYKCDLCSFGTTPSEVTLYKCDSCSFRAKYKESLKKHFTIHKSPSEITIYKCAFCSHQTKYKNSLKIHLLRHGNPSKMYKCDLCSFKTTQKHYLVKHFRVHMGMVYKCDSCSFQTKYSKSLRRHLQVHKGPAEAMPYPCASCPFRTKSKLCMKQHLRFHEDSSNVGRYKCDYCSFWTKYERAHNELLKGTVYRCDFCQYQGEKHSDLRRHLLIHKYSSEVYKYEHRLMSRNKPPEITILHNDRLSYFNKRKRATIKKEQDDPNISFKIEPNSI